MLRIGDIPSKISCLGVFHNREGFFLSFSFSFLTERDGMGRESEGRQRVQNKTC